MSNKPRSVAWVSQTFTTAISQDLVNTTTPSSSESSSRYFSMAVGKVPGVFIPVVCGAGGEN